MGAVKIIILLLKVVLALKNYLEKMGQLEAAQEQILRELDKVSAGLINKADAARAAVKHDADSVREDEFNRDKTQS